MPNATVQSYAKKSGKTTAEVEAMWNKAKEGADKAIGNKGSRYWAYVSGTVKKMLGLNESTSFKEFIDLSFDVPQPVANVPVEIGQETPETPDSSQQGIVELSIENFGRFISVLFAARDKSHELHLSTKSYAQHVALNELYEILLEHADKLAESFQGRHGIIPICVPEARIWNQPCACTFVSALVEWFNLVAKTLIGDDAYIINQFEELVGEVYRVKYKLDILT